MVGPVGAGGGGGRTAKAKIVEEDINMAIQKKKRSNLKVRLFRYHKMYHKNIHQTRQAGGFEPV